MLIHEMKFVVDNYAIDKTQVDYIFKSDKEYLYLKQCTRIYMDQHKEQYKHKLTDVKAQCSMFTYIL